MSTNIRTVLLLAYLLCAEAPNGTLEERWLIAQTVVYRSGARSLTTEQVIYAPKQYQGVGLIDADAYRRLRRQELEENFAVALAAILMGPVARVSNFAEPNSADWQSRCELKYKAGKHHFYLCPDWIIVMDKPFALFYGYTYYAPPGWRGFCGRFETLDEAKRAGEVKREPGDLDWWQVVDLREDKIVAGEGEAHTGLWGPVLANPTIPSPKADK